MSDRAKSWLLASIVVTTACGTSNKSNDQKQGASGGATSSVLSATGGNSSSGGSTSTFYLPTGGSSSVSSDLAAPVICDLSCDSCSTVASASDYQLLTAAQVGAAVGSAVRFKAFDQENRNVVAQEIVSGESILVTSGILDQSNNTITYYRLPSEYKDWHFVTSGFLACSSDNCALFEVGNAASSVLQPIAGGTVPGGFIGDWLTLYQHQLCVLNQASTAWCFDRENWTSVEAAPIKSYTGMMTPWLNSSQPSSVQCASPTDAGASSVRWELSEWNDARFIGTTSEGQLVRGNWQGDASCCAYSEPLGAPLDLMLYECGLAENALLLTETALFGTLSCPID